MSPTLTLSAFLLLLLLPSSLTQTSGTENSTAAIKPTTDWNQGSLTATTNTALAKPTPDGLVATSSSNPNSTALSKISDSVNSSTLASASSTGDNQSGGIPTTTSSRDSEGSKTQTRPPSSSAPTSSNKQSPSSGDSSDNVTTAPPTTSMRNQLNSTTASLPTNMFDPAKLPPTPAAVSTASSQQPKGTPSQSTESHPHGQHTPSTVSSSSGYLSSTDLSAFLRTPTTYIPLSTSEVTQPTPSQMPGTPTFSTSLQPTVSPEGTEVVSTTEEFTHSSSGLTPVVPQSPSTSSPIWTFGNYKLKCDPAIIPDEELLILNLTGAGLCEGSPPDEKLVELLCHSVKASFSPAQDHCTLQMAPVLESQAVAVKGVIIETKLPPKAVYEVLKDKWNDLREAGVSDMTLGREGPPEANEDRFSLPLIITIVCMASFLLLVAALYGCCHQRISQRKDQQRLTEELQTVENGYHDNPTLEVMETPSEMQEKKVVNLNGELGDSWIVPLDNLTKDDLDDEEDTHL